MNKKVILLVSIATLVMSCNQTKETRKYTAASFDSNDINATTIITQQNEGYALTKANCYVCHNPNTKSHDDILAPPFKAVKMHYIRAYDNKEEFVNAMVNWVQNPDENKALMHGAVRRFKVMPKLPLPKEDLEKIASYIYDNDVEQPEWMEGHMKGRKGENGTGRKNKFRKKNNKNDK